MPYISNTDKERQKMLTDIGVESFEDLINNIPETFRLKSPLSLEKPYSEWEISKKISALANKNISTCNCSSFLGGGIYDHYVPAAVDHIIQRPEFHTAYTPYQAEVSQGTLQHIYEFQSLICMLTGKQIANASMYDGATAAAEAILMAVRKNKRKKVIISECINPLYLEVIRSFICGIGIEIVIAPQKNGKTDCDELSKLIDDNTCSILIQTPNFLGIIEDMFKIDQLTHGVKNTLLIAAVDPISLALLSAPSEYNADIVVGEAQALGNGQFYGGPLLGFFATDMKLARQMPGRISGATVDADGNRAYSLTLQPREQHIRREKATSNICSNQSLCALAATVYLCLMGRKGLEEAATQSLTKAHYLADKINNISGYELMFNDQFFKEFVIKTPVSPGIIIDKLLNSNILAGIDIEPFGYEKGLLIAVTEKKSKKCLDDFIRALKEVNNG